MTIVPSARAADVGSPGRATPTLATVVRWMVGLRLVAVSALFLGALLVQTVTEEILPIGPLLRLTGFTYALSLVWLLLWLFRIPPGLHGALQLGGDVLIFGALVFITGGPSSPFAFLFLISVAIGAVVFGLRGALTVAGGAFVVYGGIVQLVAFGVLHSPAGLAVIPAPGQSTITFQLLVTGVGFAVVAMLTSFLAQSVKQAEERLRGEQASSARLLALSADVIRSVDSGVLATDLEGRVVLANPAAERILAGRGGIEGKTLAQLLPLEGIDWAQLLPEVAGHPTTRIDGTLPDSGLPLGCTVTPLIAEAAPVGIVVHFRDLTEAREEARRERLRERLAAVGEMAAGIAHEIRNPLASISGSAQVLGKVPSLGDNERRLSRIIVDESRRLSSIIESFLGYARPPEPQRGPCNIAKILEDTLTLFSNSSEVTACHRIRSTIRPHPNPVTADEHQLRQAFYNLARNAIQAMPTGGTMAVDGGPEDASYVIRWSDQGVGLEPQQIQEVFQPFRAFRQGGTGLGLAVVYSIISDHGGEILIDSTVGVGTTFTLRVPLEKP
jgi:two-component system sensor histidine kinase PilS (NtrC family)